MELSQFAGEFCANSDEALDKFKNHLKNVEGLDAWHRHKQGNSLLQRKDIPACIQFILQRLTKYKVIIEHLQNTTSDTNEKDKLVLSLNLVKDILTDIDSQVDVEKQKKRLWQIYHWIDAKSSAFYKNKEFKKAEVANRRLL